MTPSTRAALDAGRTQFNAREYFEAHETWEHAWRAEQGEHKQLLQALILVAAGCHKATKGEPVGTVKLLRSALGKLAPFPAVVADLALGALREQVAVALAHAERWQHDDAPPLVPELRLERASERLARAALNNAEWCAAVWRSHGLPVEQAHGLWFCPRRVPQFYPNVVTVDSDAEPRAQAALIAELARDRALRPFVKDSFDGLDLSPLGFSVQFDAHWLGLRRPTAPAQTTDGLTWRRVTDESTLAGWERAWRGGDPTPDRVFRPELLEDARVCILAGFDGQHRLCAGGIAHTSAGVTGLTNVFGAYGEVVTAVVRQLSPAEVVCYERGAELALVEQLGFAPLGRLKVWASAA
ncbi:MAG: DUF309 domain-containing protein [Myxococcota bacterium]